MQVNLVKVIRQIRTDISNLERQRDAKIKELECAYNKKIQELQTALHVNEDMNTTCLKCDGRGRVAFASASGNTEWERCSACGGSGVTGHQISHKLPSPTLDQILAKGEDG